LVSGPVIGRNLAVVDLNQIPVNTVPNQRQEGVVRLWFGEAGPFVVIPSSKEATESVIEANLDPELTI
jgi:hypothetical protein